MSGPPSQTLISTGLSLLIGILPAQAQTPPSEASPEPPVMSFEPVPVGPAVPVVPTIPAVLSTVPSSSLLSNVPSSAPVSVPPSAPLPVTPSAPVSAAVPSAVSSNPLPSSVPSGAPVPVSMPVGMPTSAAPVSTSQKSNLNATTLDNPLGLGDAERVIAPGTNTDMHLRDSTFIGTMIQNDVGQVTRAAVRASNGFEAVIEHFRDPVQADRLSLGFTTPAAYTISLQSWGGMLTDQQDKNGSVLLRYSPVVNSSIRGGALYADGETYTLVGGQYVGSRLGGFVFNVDAMANRDNALGRGFLGMMKNGWYGSAGGNTSGVFSSSQGWLPNHAGESSLDTKFGVINRVWYAKNGDEGFTMIMGPGLTLEPQDVPDLDLRVTGVGNLGVLQSWARFTPNYGGGSVLVEILAQKNDDVNTSTYGAMVSKQMVSGGGVGIENYFWGLGLVRARNDNCKGWRVVLDEAAPFTYFSERMTVQIDPETYEFDVMMWMASIRMW